MRFTNKVALITAAASGIGRASADIMASEGALVVMVDKDEAKLSAAVTAINNTIAAHGGAAEAMPADALDEAQVNALVADIARRHGRIDILVNAVGGSTIIADPAATTEKLTLTEWQALLHFNLTGTFLFTHAFCP
ncbi:MAG: SDR family NAD(P)-dependent oxidoreductase [Roseomonas sp.]|nr:SDR family NAD(P)-dependent oxidoreductase [Roseomonas sp.]MCA3379246.1 SDR family NAD(P)-dependent oxidoreductase [Roseomonas sp.]